MWKAELQLKDLLTDETLNEDEIMKIAREVVSRLDSTTSFSSEAIGYLSPIFDSIVTEDEFNDAMDDLYDIADQERVWIK